MKYILAIPLLLVATLARGQDSPAERIAPYLTETAVAVGRVDINAINVDRMLEGLGVRDGQSIDFVPIIRASLESARDAGINEIYAVVDLADVPEMGVFVVIPAEEGRVDGILQLIDGLPFAAKEAVQGAVIAGSPSMIDQIKTREKESMGRVSALTEAFAIVKDAPVQLVVAFTPDQRRVLREMLPNLPEEFGGATGEQLAAGLSWAALGLTYDPALGAKLVIQSESEQAAESLKATITAGLRRLSTEPEVLKAFPLFPMLVGSLIPERQGNQLVLDADKTFETTAKFFGSMIALGRQGANRSQSINNLKQFGLAMHNFHDVHGSFPPSAGYDANGKPLLSWRVYLLPWLEQQALYNQFRLDEPWDSEHNKTLIEKMPEVFRSPNIETPPGHTLYLAPTGEGLVFDGKAGTRFQDMTDGTSNTILIVEAAAEQAVPWTKPQDLDIDPQKPLAGIGNDRETFGALYGDGSVHQISTKADPKAVYQVMTRAGGEVIDQEKLHPLESPR